MQQPQSSDAAEESSDAAEESSEASESQSDSESDTFSMALSRWDEEVNPLRTPGQRDEEVHEEVREEVHQREDDEAFCMALGAWGEESDGDTDSESDSVARSYSPNPPCFSGDWE